MGQKKMHPCYWHNKTMLKRTRCLSNATCNTHKMFLSEHIWMTLTFRVIGSHNSTCIMGPTYWCHELDLTRSHDVIDHMTIQLAIYYILLLSHWSRASVFNRFQDICIRIHLYCDLDLSGSRDVTAHVTI